MTTIVVVKLVCEEMHLTETRMITPVLHEGGEVTGMASSSADFCGVCESSAMTILELEPQEVEGLSELERGLYELRLDSGFTSL